ncbi:unnamed protein product [Camellia sinensis]
MLQIEERSQLANKIKALSRLKAKLLVIAERGRGLDGQECSHLTMAEEKHHHQLWCGVKEVTTYGETTNAYGSGGGGSKYSESTGVYGTTAPHFFEETPDYEKKVKQHKHREQRGDLGAVVAGTFALYKKHQSKKDPEHAHKHKIEEEIAAEAAVGSGGYAFCEHYEKKNAKEEEFLERENKRNLTNQKNQKQNLEYLTLCASCFQLQEIIYQISIHCNNFVGLGVPNAYIGKSDASAIATLLPNIKESDLRCANIEKESLVMILNGCKELECVNVSDCEGFDKGDIDTLKLASHIRTFKPEGSMLFDSDDDKEGDNDGFDLDLMFYCGYRSC